MRKVSPRPFFIHYLLIFEPAHDKTCSKTYVTSKDSDEPVHPLNLERVLVYPSFNSLMAVEGTCDQRRLLSDCANAQVYLGHRWSHKSYFGIVVRLFNCITFCNFTCKMFLLQLSLLIYDTLTLALKTQTLNQQI